MYRLGMEVPEIAIKLDRAERTIRGYLEGYDGRKDHMGTDY